MKIPTIDEVRTFVENNNITSISPEEFITYCNMRHWRTSEGHPMKNWKLSIKQKAWYNRTHGKKPTDDLPPTKDSPILHDHTLRMSSLRMGCNMGCFNNKVLADTLMEASVREKTLLYIVEYLTPLSDINTFPENEKDTEFEELVEYVKFLNQAFTNASFSPIDVIKDYAHRLMFSDYIRTFYWNILAHYVKKKAGFKCIVCDSDSKLCLHYKTVENIGDITKEPNDVVCLCGDCKLKILGKYQKE